jgi:hypothetical protein
MTRSRPSCEPTPAVERAPVGEAALHGGGRMWTRHAQQILGLERCGDRGWQPCSGSFSC